MISKVAIKKKQLAVVKQIVANYRRSKASRSEMKKDDTFFGIPRTKIMVEDAQKLVDAHPKINEVVDSFSKRYAFKTQEQSRREAGQNAYKAESDAMQKEVDKGLKAKADIVAARNADNCAERLYFKLPTDQPYYADAPLTVDARWSVASSISVADVLIVDNLDFAAVPKAGRIVFDLAVCILVG